MSSTTEAWLAVPDRAALLLGGVKWSHGCDALEDASGQTIALAVQLEQVFDGLFDAGRVPHFAYVIGLLRAMKFGSSDPQFARLHLAYLGAASTTALARNAGVLIGILCRDLPWKHQPSQEGLLKSLRAMQRNGERRKAGTDHEPPLPLTEVLPRIAGRLERFSDASLAHWFRYGRDGIPESSRVEEVLESLPQRVLKLLSAVRLNPRLVGAASLVSVLDAALTLPPRKQSAQVLPQGGYADVTTRGDPDRLLPSQFALDPDDFIRRFAERELLYFKREEPHAARKPERVIVLDQGVRTWGSVRLALSGAALSLLKADGRRVGDVRVCFTSTAQTVDLRRQALDDLVNFFAASDLTPHPADTLVQALTEPGDATIPRDIILLTHPNNLPILFLETQQRRRPGDRIFALSVKDDGVARLDELFEDGLRTLRMFKLDLATAEAVRLVGAPRVEIPKVSGAWTGDVEPIGFPFRPGLVGEPLQFAFSDDGQWLVILCRDGLVHGLSFDGSPPEVLPRAFRDGAVLKKVNIVQGVNNGVVLCGRMKLTAESAVENEIVAHYDFRAKTLRLHVMTAVTGNYTWHIDSEVNIIVREPGENRSDEGSFEVPSVDLLHPDQVPYGSEDTAERKRVSMGMLSRDDVLSLPATVRIVLSRSLLSLKPRNPVLFLDENTIDLRVQSQEWVPFEPRCDGQPLLAGKTIRETKLARNVLAMKLGKASGRNSDTIVLFRGPDGAILGEYGGVHEFSPFNLSPDGTKLARRSDKRSISVHSTAEAGKRIAAASPARLHENLRITVQDRPLHLQFVIGRHTHLIWVDDSRLVHRMQAEKLSQQSFDLSYFSSVAYDTDRFYFPKSGPSSHFWKVVPDRWGAVHLLTANNVFIASFLIRRDRAAAWIPDGTFWGDAALIGGPAHPDAAARIGKAIHDAGGPS